MQTLTRSSLNGTSRGVAGASFTSSLNGMIKERAGVFGTVSLSLVPSAPEGAGGGGIISPSPGAGSLKTGIRDDDATGADAKRCCRPGCRRVVPFSFETFGTFSFIRSFRVPSSFHGVVAFASPAACASSPEAPEGSTKICIRAFGLGRRDGPDVGPKTSPWGIEDAVVDVECADRVDDPDVQVDSPKTLRRVTVAAVDCGCSSGGVASRGRGVASIMRF
jgi:hypothetical protein